MNKKGSYEDRLTEFEISLVNQPVDLTERFEVEALTAPLTARQIADRKWEMEGRKGSQT